MDIYYSKFNRAIELWVKHHIWNGQQIESAYSYSFPRNTFPTQNSEQDLLASKYSNSERNAKEFYNFLLIRNMIHFIQ